MKKILLVMLLITISLTLIAKPVATSVVDKAVNNFITSKSESFTVGDRFSYNTKQNSDIHIYNLNPIGFVVMTGDDNLSPVLAYSFKNNLDKSRFEENPFFDIFAADVEKRINYYRENPSETSKNENSWLELIQNEIRDDRPAEQWPTAGSTITDGWVETSWNQSGVLNDMCPLDNSNERSVVGCVATAMAMIVDFHKYIGTPTFNNYDSYTSWSQNIHIDADAEERDFPTFEELNVYLENVSYNYANNLPLSGDDLAALNFACGVSVEMSYSSDGSGAQTAMVANALLNKFDFDSANHISNYGASFYNTLSGNMQDMQPAEISIYTDGWNSGHAIIVDGYNTDDYYHLNYGWGTSNSTCWYLLPDGMPSNYSIVGGAVVNIEGGAIPIQVTGNVAVDGDSSENTQIILAGIKTFGCLVENADGDFEMGNVLSGEYSVTAIKDNGAYYQYIENVIIDEDNTTLQINLDDFRNFTGSVTAPISSENTNISFYRDDFFVGETNVDENGDYLMHNIIPGTYEINASLAGNYFVNSSYTVDISNQHLDLELEEYSGDLATSFASYPESSWSLIPNYTLSCGVKISADLENVFEDDIISKVRFIAPIDQNEGEIFAQLWKGETVISQIEVSNFSKNSWVEITFDKFAKITANQDYYIGYEIFSETGDFAIQDGGPHRESFGAFTRTSGWNEINGDNNFCIEPIIISNNYGEIQGNIQLINLGNIEPGNIIIKAGDFASHPDADGNYQLQLLPGNYDIFVETSGASASLSNINISESEIIENINFVLNGNLASDEDFEISKTDLIGNYPNPFNPSAAKRCPTTTISFSLKNNENVTIDIFNSKGQKVKRVLHENLSAGSHQISWNGKDSKNSNVSSGIYFYKMQTSSFSSIKKMILIK